MSAPITPADVAAATTPPAAPPAEAPPAAPAETPPTAPVAVAPPAEATPPPAAPPAAEPPAQTPPWGDDDTNYDPAKAAQLIANLRAENSKLKGKAPADPAAPADPGVDVTALQADAVAWRTHAVDTFTMAKAADKFGDPVAALALAGIGDGSAFVDGNTINETKIVEALERVAEKHPLLLKQPPVQGFTPDRGQGQAGTGQVPIDSQIQAAQASGNIIQSIALKQAKYAASQPK